MCNHSEYCLFCQDARNGSIASHHPSPYAVGMPYTMNPYLPKLRADAVNAVHQGDSIRAAARHIGVEHSTVLRWMRQAPRDGRVFLIPTRSSRPHQHPHAIDRSIVDRIRGARLVRGRCAEVIHAALLREGVLVSLSTVKRTLAREGLLRKRSPWKHLHQSGVRPIPETPGMLVEMDTVHLWESRRSRTYVLTMIDVCSRWAAALAVPRVHSVAAARMVERARRSIPFPMYCIQTDHGSEFSTHFTRRLLHWQIRHRHIRIRKPNDNAHIERFNRTLQDELETDLIRYRTNLPMLNHALMDYLTYYNTDRLHLGLGCQTPSEVVRRC